MNRTSIFLKNSTITALSQIITMLMSFITIRLIIETYGSEMNGLVVSINQFIAYFKIVEAGLSSAAIYILYKPLAEKDINLINLIVSTTKYLYKKAGFLFIGLIILLCIIYPLIIEDLPQGKGYLVCLILILGISSIIDFFLLAKYRVLLTADQRTYVLSMAGIVQTLINGLIILLCTTLKIDFLIMWGLTVISIFARTLILIFYIRRKYAFLKYNIKPQIQLVNQRWDALYLQILGAIQMGASVVLLTIMNKDLELISIFSVYLIVITGVNSLLEIFKSGLFSTFGQIIAKKELNLLKDVTQEFEVFYYIVLGVVYSVTFCAIIPFIELFTANINDIEYAVVIYGFLFALDGVLNSIRAPQGMLVISAGMFKETKFQVTIQAAIFLIFGILLVEPLGIIGVLIASIISSVYRTIEMIYFVPKYITHMSWKPSFRRILTTLTTILIIYIIYLKFNEFIIVNYLDWFIMVIVLLLWTSVIFILLAIIFDKRYFKRIISRFKRIIKK